MLFHRGRSTRAHLIGWLAIIALVVGGVALSQTQDGPNKAKLNSLHMPPNVSR
jgi:hypothetical protein